MSDTTKHADESGQLPDRHYEPASTTGQSQTTEGGGTFHDDVGSSLESVPASNRSAGHTMAIAPPIANKKFSLSIQRTGDQIIAANRRAYNAWDFGYTFWDFPGLERLRKVERPLVMAYIEQERDIATRALRRPRR